MSTVRQLLSQARRRQQWFILALTGGVVIAAAGIVLFPRFEFSRLEVTIAPAAALAAAEFSVISGYGLVHGSRAWILSRRDEVPALRVLAPGYTPETIPLRQTTRARGRLDVILDELPATVQAATEPSLAETHWSLDGRIIARGPRFTSELPAGAYTIGAAHPYFITASRSLTVARGEAYSLLLPLTPAAARLELSSTPSAAEVTHNGAAVGKTPLSLDTLGGIHELSIAYSGYELRADTLELTRDTPAVKRHYRLDRAQAQATFTLAPAGGVLYLGGRAVAQTAALGLAAGVTHQARYTLPGHAPEELDFTLRPGEHRHVELTLIPILGTVEVHTEPRADVEVNGRAAGRAPLGLQLPSAPQTIRLSLPGYQPVTRTVTPSSKTPQYIRVALKPLAQERRAPTPAQYTNSAGIALKLFKTPAAARLGTPRGQPGRRANEFIRKVHFTRPFYAGIYEVTVSQYRQFTHPEAAPVADYRPVTGVSWEDAARYCNWLSDREGLAPVYNFENDSHVGSNAGADGYRLLTEAEWEWLARKAMRGQETLFPWGDDKEVPPGSGNFADQSARGQVPVYISRYNDGFAQLAEVGKFRANAAGIHDLAGNAREWTHSVYEVRPLPPGKVETDPLDIGPGSRHTVKGSSWRSGTLEELRAAWRKPSDTPGDDLGFRVARYLVGEH